MAIDFDDTLCLTEEACFRLENQVASQLGFSPQIREIHQKTWGQPVDLACQTRFPGIDKEAFKDLLGQTIPEFVQRGELDAVTEENYGVLDQIKLRGLTLAIVTSRTESEAKHLLHPNHPLSLKIDAFYHGDNTRFPKPDPRVFDEMLREFSIQPNQALYIGDSIGDAKSAKGAKLNFIASLESGLRTREDFKGLGVDIFIDKFPQILDFIL